MNLKIGKLEAIFLVLIVMINKILLNIPKEIIKQSQTGSPVNIIFTSILILIITLLICKLFQKFPNEDIIDISKYVGKKPLQIILGTLLLILFTIYLIFDNKIITSIGKDIDIRIYIYLIITFVICLTNITCCSISMEKQNFYMLKTLPLSEKEILNSKLKLNILLVLPSVIFFLIVIYLKGYIKFYDAYLLLFYSCFLNLFVSMYGLVVNLKFPMFDALNDQIIVKRSTSVLIGTIVLTIICLCLVSFVMEYNVKYNHLIELSILIVLTLDIIFNFILNKWGIKRFRKL